MASEKTLLLILLAVGGLGGFIFGFNTGIIAGALPAMEPTFSSLERSTVEQGVVTTSILLGALIGAAFGASLAAIISKKVTVLLIGIITVVGCLGAALSPYLWVLVLFRELSGVAVGLASVICPIYVSELAPKKYSGALGSWFQVTLTFGIFMSYLASFLITYFEVPYDFRWMFGLGILPGALLCVVFFFMPSAPSDQVPVEYQQSQDKYSMPNRSTGLKLYVHMIRQCPKEMLLGIFLCLTLQLTGINAVLYYAPVIFENAGLEGNTASLLASLGVGGWNFIATFIALFLVDRAGRRPLVLIGLLLMIISLFLLTFTFGYLTNKNASLSGILSIVFLLVYIMGFEMGVGSLFWPLITETFPSEFTEPGASVLNVIQWSLNIILAASFPGLIQVLSQSIVFLGFGIIGVICFIFLVFKLKETKGERTSDPAYDVQTVNQNDEHIFTDAEDAHYY